MALARRSALGQWARIVCNLWTKADFSALRPCKISRVCSDFSLSRDIFQISNHNGGTFRLRPAPFGRYRYRDHVHVDFFKENFLSTFEGHDPVPQEEVPDWHPADVLAALKKRGLSLAGISMAHGYHATAAGKALKRSWPAMEAVIAEAIGRKPEEIWPSRYMDGQVVRLTRNRVNRKP